MKVTLNWNPNQIGPINLKKNWNQRFYKFNKLFLQVAQTFFYHIFFEKNISRFWMFLSQPRTPQHVTRLLSSKLNWNPNQIGLLFLGWGNIEIKGSNIGIRSGFSVLLMHGTRNGTGTKIVEKRETRTKGLINIQQLVSVWVSQS